MSRRASTSAHPAWMLITVVLVLSAIAGGYVLYNKVSDPYRTMTKLPVTDYLENSSSLRGNTYKLDGTIAISIDWSPTAGRLFSVELVEGEMVAILIPPEFNQVNIERGQRYLFKLEVADKGVLRVLDVKKA